MTGDILFEKKWQPIPSYADRQTAKKVTIEEEAAIRQEHEGFNRHKSVDPVFEAFLDQGATLQEFMTPQDL